MTLINPFPLEDQALVDEISAQVNTLSVQVNDLSQVLTTSVDPGYFQNVSPGHGRA